MLDLDEFRSENQRFLKEKKEKNPEIPKKIRIKHKEMLNIANFHEAVAWKHMLDFFKIDENFKAKSKEILPDFRLYNINKIKEGTDKKIPAIIVFLYAYELYNDIIHAKFLDKTGEISGSFPKDLFVEENEKNKQEFDIKTKNCVKFEKNAKIVIRSNIVFFLKNVIFFIYPKIH